MSPTIWVFSALASEPAASVPPVSKPPVPAPEVTCADVTVVRWVPPGAVVNERDCQDFTVAGRAVRFVHVAYGAGFDCPAGCIYSHVCAVEDASDSLLYLSRWLGERERPVRVEEACPVLADSRVGSTWVEGCDPPGMNHPLATDRSFREFAAVEVGRGPFRWCTQAPFWEVTYPGTKGPAKVKP